MAEFEYPPGATPLEPDEAEGLLLPHITTRSELDRWEQDNILEAETWRSADSHDYSPLLGFVRS